MKKTILITCILCLAFEFLYWGYWYTNTIINRMPSDKVFQPNLFVTPASLDAAGYVRDSPSKEERSAIFTSPESSLKRILSILGQRSPFLSKRLDSTTYINYLIPPGGPDIVFAQLIVKNVAGLDSAEVMKWIASNGGKVVSPVFKEKNADCFYILGIKSGLYFRAAQIAKGQLWIYVCFPDTFEAKRSKYRANYGDGETGFIIQDGLSSNFYYDL